MVSLSNSWTGTRLRPDDAPTTGTRYAGVVRGALGCGAAVVGRLKELPVGAVALAFQVIDGDEAKGGGVDAVAQAAGFPGPVVEHVAQVAAAVGGADLGPGEQHLEVAAPDHVARLDRGGEAGPAGVAVEFAGR